MNALEILRKVYDFIGNLISEEEKSISASNYNCGDNNKQITNNMGNTTCVGSYNPTITITNQQTD